MSEEPRDKMSLIYLTRTGQILAAATRGAVPAGAVPTGSETDEQLAANAAKELKILVGDEIVVRDLPVHSLPTSLPTVPELITAGFSLPSTELNVITLDLDLSLFRDARNFVIEDKKPPPQPSLDPTRINVDANATSVKVTLPAKPATKTAVSVWVYHDDKSKPPDQLNGEIDPAATPPGDTECTLPVRLATGLHYFLTLVQGYKAIVLEDRITP